MQVNDKAAVAFEDADEILDIDESYIYYIRDLLIKLRGIIEMYEKKDNVNYYIIDNMHRCFSSKHRVERDKSNF